MKRVSTTPAFTIQNGVVSLLQGFSAVHVAQKETRAALSWRGTRVHEFLQFRCPNWKLVRLCDEGCTGP
ncbi:hypothetical protein Y032_0024g1053 [Ancylostoma ceylanicum]|uniref:Uncharacterized protein n=1 Tax=Ancylostoma ceylanicum TaxID=53326 RepID=A0A016UX71_9BILA|nr:hypothetical protein Y032_0024g1053 [Ancylostoma ceylanicum]